MAIILSSRAVVVKYSCRKASLSVVLSITVLVLSFFHLSHYPLFVLPHLASRLFLSCFFFFFFQTTALCVPHLPWLTPAPALCGHTWHPLHWIRARRKKGCIIHDLQAGRQRSTWHPFLCDEPARLLLILLKHARCRRRWGERDESLLRSRRAEHSRNWV